MMDSIKYIELLGKFKSDKIYYLYKTSSSEINLDILSQLQKYELSLDFFSYYTKNDIKNLINSVNQLEKNLNYIFNDNSNNFESDADKYISQISKIILMLNLILKTQEILNKLLLKSKQYLNEISNNSKIENIYQDKLLSLINNLQNNYSNDISSPYYRFSIVSTTVNSSTSLNSWNKTSSQKQLKTTDEKTQEEFFNDKKLSIINEKCLSDVETPAFCEIEKKISNKDSIKKSINNSNNNVSNDIDLNISLRDMIFTPASETKTVKKAKTVNESKSKRKKGKSFKKKRSLFLDKHAVKSNNNLRSLRFSTNLNEPLLDENEEIKMCSDLLILIKNLYKNCLITADEKIELKKLVISKSRKIVKFYLKEFESIKNNNDEIATALKNLL